MKKKIFLIFFAFYQFISAYSKLDNFHIISDKAIKNDLSITVEKNTPFKNSQSSINANQNIIYLSPYPNSKLNSPTTNIIIRSKKLLDISTVGNTNILSVKGSESGSHSGKITIAEDKRTILFNPGVPFTNGETVTVSLNDGLMDNVGSQIGGISFNFSISLRNPPPTNAFSLFAEELKSVPSNYQQNASLQSKDLSKKIVQKSAQTLTLPSDFPYFSMQEGSNQSPGLIFLDNVTWNLDVVNQPFLMILDNSGAPFFYKKVSDNALGLVMQPNGIITYYDGSKGYFYGMDSTFTVVDSFYCGNGYLTDVHELKILPNGHFLLIGDDYEYIDMSKVVSGGNPQARVIGIIIQELDQKKNVVFQWRSWDHFNITDATSDIDLLNTVVDYVHTNAIELDNDGNILISNRHLDEITKIDRQTGEIIWRLGGKNNQFQLLNDNIWFSHQHDIRRLPNGDISMFDDGNLHANVAPSRAVEYKLDEVNKTINLVWFYENDPAEFSGAMGNVQRLSNGNTIIGWGSGSPAVTEVTPSGQKIYELTLAPDIYSYRAYKINLSKAYYSSFVPGLVYPGNGNTVSENQFALSWRRNKFAQSFHIQIAKDSAFTNIVYDIFSLRDTTFIVNSLEYGKKYYWHVSSNNNSENIGGYSGYSDTWTFNHLGTTSVASNNNIPISFALSQNYPNPFNPSTNIKYDIPKTSIVKIRVFNELGEEIKTLVNEEEAPGSYQITFEGDKLASGIYFYNIEAKDPLQNSSPEYIQTKKMILIK